MSTKSLYYNHPYWPSPRAARIARLLFDNRPWYIPNRVNRPEGRLTHDKALKVMADKLSISVHEFLHIKPIDALIRLRLAHHEDDAIKLLGNSNSIKWPWIIGGYMPFPCCVVCERVAPVQAHAQAPAQAPAVEVQEPDAEVEETVQEVPEVQTPSEIIAALTARVSELEKKLEAAYKTQDTIVASCLAAMKERN